MNELRPTQLSDIIGQKQIKRNLDVLTKSANIRGSALPHILFNGPPGLGKTTLSMAVANGMGVEIQVANGANLRNIKSLLPYISRITKHSIFFVDEIHRCSTIVEETLYPVMEDFRCDVTVKKEQVSFDVPKFTLIGATTESGGLSKPLYDRFSHKFELELYSDKELVKLTKINAGKLNVVIGDGACIQLVKAARGTPRIANHLLEWMRDLSITKGGSINDVMVKEGISDLGITNEGLTISDRNYLKVLSDEPIGVNTIAATTGISRDTIENVIEPFLLRLGKIKKTTKGRILC